MPDPTPPVDPNAAPPVNPPAEPPAPPSEPPVNPPTPQGTPDPRVGDPEFKIPEQYVNEAWAKNLKSHENLWQEMANAQTLIGKKGIIPPGPNASAEEIMQFHIRQGMPQNPEGYEFKTIEPLKDKPRDEVFDNRVKNILHKHRLPKEVGQAIVQDMEQLFFEQSKPKLEARTQLEKDYAALRAQTFGADADVASNQFKEVIKNSLADKPHLAQKFNDMDNDTLVMLQVYAKKIHDTYVGESKITLPGGTPPGGDLQTKFQNLSSEKLRVKQDTTLTKTVKDQKLAELNRQMRAVGDEANAKGIQLFTV